MATFVVAHGAWSAGWAWKKMRGLLRDAGHELVTPTYTGLGERSHLAHPGVDLECHVRDVLAVMHYEDLKDVILIGHSYGGMVATVVADRAPQRISQLVYLDAFVPRDGQSLLDLLALPLRLHVEQAARDHGDGWRIPDVPPPPDTGEEDLRWFATRREMQPIATLRQKVRLTGAVDRLPRTYIYCTRTGELDLFARFAKRARRASDWHYLELETSHSPHVTAPHALGEMLLRIESQERTATARRLHDRVLIRLLAGGTALAARWPRLGGLWPRVPI